MTTKEKPSHVHLKDYKETPYVIDSVFLTFELEPEATIVRSQLKIQSRQPGQNTQALELHGENLELVEIKVDGENLNNGAYNVSSKTLTISQVPSDAFDLEITTKIAPIKNTALEGLYITDNMFCTQNESEGFRKITYFYDRPDILSKYTTKIIADKSKYPTLLSNGNLKEEGDLPNGQHFVVWEDPFPKPCYLFALVGGDLSLIQDTFETCSGRTLDLRIYVDKGNESKCDHAMESLKKAMKWDEDRFGRECDLDTYMIVAVSAFNFGAMENKGLNIFNSQYALADPETATDKNYEDIESVIGHEYFHNWSGNRVTCRDWFQITLKEGLTIFRDQEFSCDMGSRAVKRISDARILQDYQFIEDAGPNAHPIQPKSYIEVNNFYTTTVYQKGSEVIRMIYTLIGQDAFRKSMDIYFKEYDGQAVTTEEFVSAMEKGSGRDLQQFRKWYDQVGTPVCHIRSEYDENKNRYKLVVSQDTGKSDTALHFPLVIGLLDQEGKEISIPNSILEVKEKNQEFIFENINQKPTPSILRNFSAPIKYVYDYSEDELGFLFAHDSDPYARYEAGQRLSLLTIQSLMKQIKSGSTNIIINQQITEAFKNILGDANLDGQYQALATTPPSLVSILESMDEYDVPLAFSAREHFLKQTAQALSDDWLNIYKKHDVKESYSYQVDQIEKRTIRNAALSHLCNLDKEEYSQLAYKQFKESDNMTDKLAALSCLSNSKSNHRNEALSSFYEEWKNDALVMNKWIIVQALSKTEGLLPQLKKIELDPVFDIKNPNKSRALFGAFTQNLVHFHAVTGEGYAWIADKIVEIDEFNPKAAAHLATSFKKYPKLPAHLKEMLKAHLERILSKENLSQDTLEIVSNTLKSGA